MLIDVDVGLPAAGAIPPTPGALADKARFHKMEVRGGHGLRGPPHARSRVDTKADLVERSMALLRDAHDAVGGDIVSGGGTRNVDHQPSGSPSSRPGPTA